MTAPLPKNEDARLRALHDCAVLDTPAEEDFDEITRLAAHICGVPIAAVSLVDAERQWFKSIVGLPVTETPRDSAFCAHAILRDDVLVVPDARADLRFVDNPLVTGDPRIRFYAGAPLITEDGQALGSLCVIDRTPRHLTADQQEELRLLARLVTSQLERSRRAAEREKAEAERRESEAERLRLAAIIETSHDAIYSMTPEGCITSWNRAAERLYGYAAAEMIGRNISLLVPPGLQAELDEALAAVGWGMASVPLETVRLTKSGARLNVCLRASPLTDAQGRVVGVSMIAQDVTARKRAEEALHHEREFTQALLESIQEGIVACDSQGTLTLFNRAARDLHGLPAEPLPAEEWAEHFDLYAADGVTPMQTRDIPLFRAFQGETVRDAEMVVAPRSDIARTLLASGQAIRDGSGRKLGAVVAMHDITERRRAERELARLAAIVESCEDAIVAATLDGTIIGWNRGAERLYGYAAAEMVGRSATVLAADGAPSPVPAIVTRLLRGETVEPMEVARVRRDGTGFCALLTFSPIRDASAQVVGLSCIARDITARKEIEAALAESEARLRRLTDAAFEGIAVTQGGALVDVSPAFAALFGYADPAEMAGLSASLLLSPASLASVLQDDAEHGDEPYEATLRRRDGSAFQAEMRGRMIQLGGRAARVTAVRDVSEQRAMEERLGASHAARAISEARLAEAQRVAGIGSWHYDLTTDAITLSAEMYRLFEMDPAEGPRALEQILARYHPDDVPMHKAIFEQSMRDGTSYEFDIRVVRRNGDTRWMHVSGECARDASGRPLRLFGTLMDIHERKGMEEELRASHRAAQESAARLAEAQRVAKIGSWEYDLVTDKVAWSDELFRLFGLDSAEGQPGYEAAVALYHPEDAPVLDALVARSAREGVGFELDLRGAPGAFPDGRTRWYHALGTAHADEEGRIVRLTGTLADITDRKEAEEALRENSIALEESRRFARSVAENSASIIFVFDLETKANVYANRDVGEFLGYAPEQVAALGADLLPAMIHPEDLPRLLAHLEEFEAAQDEQVVEFEYRALHADGGWRWIWNREVVFERRADGRPRTILGNAQDITAQKTLEASLRAQAEQLRRNEAALRAVLESAPVILYAADADGTVTLSEGTGLASLGLKPGEAVGRSVFDFSDGDAESDARTRRALAGEALSYDAHIYGLSLHTEVRPLRDADGALAGIIGVCFDVTERVASEERFRVLFERSSDAHLLVGEGGIVDCNNAAVALLRCEGKDQLLSLHPAVLSPEFQPDGRRSRDKGPEMEEIARRTGFHRFEWTHHRRDGEEFPVEVALTPVTLADRPVMLAVLHDLTERKRAEETVRDHAVVLEFQKQALEEANAELEALATTDGMTGLKNHRTFQEQLADEVNRAGRYHTPLSLVILDIDHFKGFNDAFGHPAGDTVLKAVARILQGSARETDLVARYGGEEFVLLLPQTDAAGAALFAERLRAAIEGADWPVRAVTASLGVACLRPGVEDGGALIARADEAMYLSKTGGRNRVTAACAAPVVPHPVEA